MAAGKLVRVMTARRGDGQGNRNSTNITYKKQPNRKNKKKAVVSKSYKQAYYKMLPSKENRENATQLGMTTTGIANFMKLKELSNIAQGTQNNQRMRNQIHISYLQLRGTISTDSNEAKFLRVMIVRPKAVSPNVADLATFNNFYLNASYAGSAPTGLQVDGRHRINTELYEVYYDHKYNIPPTTQGALNVSKNVRINQIFDYGYANAASVTPLNGSLYIVLNLFEVDNTANTIVSTVSLETRLFFKDYNRNSSIFVGN